EAAENQEDGYNLIKAYSFTGVAYRNRGFYLQALDYYTQGLELALELDDREQQCYGYINLANLHLYLGSPEESERYLKSLQPIAEEVGNPNILGYSYLNYGRTLLALKRHEEALEYIRQSLEVRRATGNLEGQSVCTKYIGDVYLDAKNYRLAQRAYEEALATTNFEYDIDLFSSTTNGLAQALLHQGEWSPAKRNALKSLASAEGSDFILRAKEASETLADIANHEQEYQEADKYRQAVIDYQNKLALEDLQLMSDRFNFQLQAAEIQYDKERQAIQYGRWLILAVAGGIVIILAILFGAWYMMYRRREAYQQKLLEVVQAQKDELEDRVAERTKELIDKNAKMKRLSRYKEELTHMIAHDLKNPLNIILGLSDDPKWGRKAQSMKEAGQTMLQMVTNMLDVQKFEEAKMQLDSSHLRLVDVVEKAGGQVDLLVQAKSLVLHNQVSKDWVVYADESLLIRIFLNLFTNAIKYSNLGGSITVGAELKTEGWLAISVADEGQGMDETSRNHIFDKYFQTKARKSGKTRSTGLGLTFCQMAVEAHGGVIEVASAPEQGTRFTLTLPQGDVSSCYQEKAEVPRVSISQDALTLSPDDWQQLGDLPERLRNTPLYEAGIIRALLQEISEGNATFAEWKEEIIKAALHWNEERYQQLLTPESAPAKTN
ncbi:MAG TPA: hypothetical protein DCE41_35870, partial [Cytophagales bacterium]|nr:hypothetical protein [Cytophagales bacterium]